MLDLAGGTGDWDRRSRAASPGCCRPTSRRGWSRPHVAERVDQGRGASRDGHAGARPARTTASTASFAASATCSCRIERARSPRRRRVLKRGGRLAFATWAPADRNPWATAYGPVADRRGSAGAAAARRARPVRARRAERRSSPSCGTAGFEEIEVDGGADRVPVRELGRLQPAGRRAWPHRCSEVAAAARRKDVLTEIDKRRTRAPRALRTGDGLRLARGRTRHRRELRGSSYRARSRRARRRGAPSRWRGRGSGSPRRARRSRRGLTRQRARARGAPRGRRGRPRTGVPTPGATSGSRASRSSDTCTKPGPAMWESDSRIARSIPIRSMSLIVYARIPRSRMRWRSPSSSDRRADQRHPVRIDGREGPAVLEELAADRRARPRGGMPCTFPLGESLWRVDVAVRVDPADAAGHRTAREPAQRAHRDGVVAAENERDARPRRPPARDKVDTRAQAALISGR